MTIAHDAQGAIEPLPRAGSVRRAVSERLRSALISGRMRAGELYSAPQLAEMLGVSATPVREAMLDLVREQMVEVVPNKGFRVRTLSDRELDELVEIRLLIEVPVMAEIARTCEGAVADGVRALEPLALDLEGAARDGDLVRFIVLDTEFHSTFLALHGNETLVGVIREFRGRSRLYGLQKLADAGALEETAAEHREMVRLALSRDGDGMTALLRQHIAHIRGEWARGEDAP
ncbi:GntR family transcriptional regulator [Microbacterium sp. 18062]|uniref:GntR family transcriptional regulator n=1 Tax=Microbacterium sp. 18062 TaxID=2681410 RepID=UPI001356C774|nr:GntR family transcriptional regulator [Microbacterium sp. 18062]